MDLFSSAHVAVLLTTAALCIGAVILGRTASPAFPLTALARTTALLLVTSEIAIRVVLLADGDWSWKTDLPLQLSDAALIAAAVALWPSRPPALAYELTYFWALTATLQAVLTPDLNHGPGHIFFWTFFIAHSGVLVAAAYLTWGRGNVLRARAVPRVLGVTVGWTALAAVGCLVTGGNYMFLREPPPRGSLLDLFGPWPWYLVGAAGIAVAVFTLLARIHPAPRPEPG